MLALSKLVTINGKSLIKGKILRGELNKKETLLKFSTSKSLPKGVKFQENNSKFNLGKLLGAK